MRSRKYFSDETVVACVVIGLVMFLLGRWTALLLLRSRVNRENTYAEALAFAEDIRTDYRSLDLTNVNVNALAEPINFMEVGMKRSYVVIENDQSDAWQVLCDKWSHEYPGMRVAFDDKVNWGLKYEIRILNNNEGQTETSRTGEN